MTLNLEITPELEKHLRQAASQLGLSVNTYAVQILHQSLQFQPAQATGTTSLPKEEADLIQVINQSLSDIEWQRYHVLIEKRQAETLQTEEQTALVRLSNRLEMANVERIQAVAKLAQIRNTSIPALMDDLGLKPVAHA
ncbi:MAG: hypothetical protein AAFR42_01515 [Cyanobacteria bacterium J06628_6]